MKVGSKFKIDWQCYEVVGTRDHWTRNDRYVELLLYEAPCAACGRLFRYAATKSWLKRKNVNRRCEQHKRSGDPVPKRKPSKAAMLAAREPPAKRLFAARPAPSLTAPPVRVALEPPRPSYLD